jgi:hypothetical protein
MNENQEAPVDLEAIAIEQFERLRQRKDHADDEADAEERQRTLRLYNEIVAIWKEHIGTKWATPCKAHKCVVVQADTINENIIDDRKSNAVGVNSNNATEISKHFYHEWLTKEEPCNIINIRAKVYMTRRHDVHHICIAGYCASEGKNFDMHHSIIRRIDDIYVCENTAIPHFCGHFCSSDRQVLNKDNIYTCPLTGRSLSTEVEVRDQFWNKGNIKQQQQADRETAVNPFKASTNRKRKKSNNNNEPADPDINIKDVDDILDKCVRMGIQADVVMDALISTKKRKKDGSINSCTPTMTLKTEYLLIAVIKLAKMFSRERFENDMKKEEETQKELLMQFSKYTATKTRSNDILSICELYVIALQHRKKKCTVIDFTGLTDTQRKGLIMYYAKMCIALWYVVVTKTTMGQKKTDYPWYEFIDSAMRLFETGLIISELDYGRKVTIIEPDPFLALLTDDNSYMKNNSNNNNNEDTAPQRRDSYKTGVHQQRHSKKNNLTKIKNATSMAITFAVIKDGIPPERLRPEMVDFDTIDEKAFTKIRGKNRK